MNMGVENGDVNGGNCYMNRSPGSQSNNQNFIYYTKKRDVMLPVSKLNKYANME